MSNINISSSAVLIDVSISVWTGRKLDRKVSEEIDGAKRTKTRAGNYNKNLLAGSDELKSIAQLAGEIRNWHYARTLAWSDSGTRLLPTAQFFEYKQGIAAFQLEFEHRVKNFLDAYPVTVSAAAFTMGDLFDRSEYPDASEIANKFKFVYTISPVPESGDFRVDVSNDAMRELALEYETAYSTRVNDAMQSVWDKVHESLKHIAERLGYDEEGKKLVFKNTTIEGVNELIGLLGSLNITKDCKLDAMRLEMERIFGLADAEDLRSDEYLRGKVRSEVQDLLEKFSL